MTNSIISIKSIEKRKALFEIRNTLFRRRDILKKALFRRADVDQEMRYELKRIETVLEQMRCGTHGKWSQIPIDDLIANPFLTIAE